MTQTECFFREIVHSETKACREYGYLPLANPHFVGHQMPTLHSLYLQYLRGGRDYNLTLGIPASLIRTAMQLPPQISSNHSHISLDSATQRKGLVEKRSRIRPNWEDKVLLKIVSPGDSPSNINFSFWI